MAELRRVLPVGGRLAMFELVAGRDHLRRLGQQGRAPAGAAQVSLRGEEDAPPFEQSEAIQAVIAEPDPRRQLELYGRVLADVQPRLAPLTRLLREAAPSDPALAETLERNVANRLEAMGKFAALLESRGALRAGLSVDRARDALWTVNSPELCDMLVVERGWEAEEYAEWVAVTLGAALLSVPG